MFTGIVEETGTIIAIGANSITIECQKILEDVKLGDSIMVNGVCQTVIDFGENFFRANLSQETLNITTFSDSKQGDIVNLERALTLNTRLGGHLVSGHTDCKGQLISVQKNNQFYDMTFEIPAEFAKYIAYKGSITVNGISLTIAEINNNTVKVAVIPHTFENTNLKTLKNGDFVNIETDILAKYVEKMLSANDNKSKINMKFLAENGFV